jgi:hypothetical protein
MRRGKMKAGLFSLAGVALVSLLAVGASLGQPPQAARTLMATPFEKDANGWMTFGEKAKTAVEADTVTGKGTLRYDYQVEKGGLSLMILPVNPGEIGDAKAIRFAVKTDYPTTVVVSLQESEAGKEEGRYTAVFYSPGEKWQEVALAPTDFVRDEETAAKDSNNKLDLDKVAGVAVTDFLQIFAQGDDKTFAELVGFKPGAHKMWLRDFRVTTETLPGAPFLTPTDPRLDTFAHPQIGWVGIGGMKLASHAGRPVEGRGIKATYPYGPGKMAGMVRPIPVGRLAGKEKLSLGLASAKPVTVVIQLEEQGGGKYDATAEIGGGSVLKPLELSFSEFKLSMDSKDPDNKLDLAKVKHVVIVDASGLIGAAQEEAENTLYLSGLRAR